MVGDKSDGSDKIYRLTIRMNEKQYKLTRMLAKYLHQTKRIERESINATVNYSLMYLAYVIAKNSEMELMKSDEEDRDTISSTEEITT